MGRAAIPRIAVILLDMPVFEEVYFNYPRGGIA